MEHGGFDTGLEEADVSCVRGFTTLSCCDPRPALWCDANNNRQKFFQMVDVSFASFCIVGLFRLVQPIQSSRSIDGEW